MPGKSLQPLPAAFLLVALFFVYRSFYGMRIGQVESTETAKSAAR